MKLPAKANRLCVSFLGLVLCLGSAAHAQEGPPSPGGNGEDPYEHIKLGKRALDRGDRDEALHQWLQAVGHQPGSLELIELLLRQCSDDEDARALWSHAWYGAACDAQGQVRPSLEVKKLLAQEDRHLPRLAVARARAVAELIAFAEARVGKTAEDLLLAWWARRLASELAQPCPALDPGGDTLFTVPDNFHTPVVKALEQAMKAALSSRRTAVAMRAGRILHGMAVQAGFKDLKGERPKNMDRVRRAAGAGLAKARAQLEKAVGEPWTVEELEWLSTEEGEAFTRDHETFGLPGVALSPNRRYRVETDCGWQTLMGVARTVEDHHNRLVNWFGKDPFKGEQGIIRIVPESQGLEAEGVPFWWAGGMQGGRVTTLQLSHGNVEGLGHGITHELTHRFDGALFPGLPLWLVEGRAVWTGSAYGSSADEKFVPNHVSFGTMESAFIKGYGGKKKLTELITQELEDYRDNYVAGYALYVYLNTWEAEGKKIYADRLKRYMLGLATRNKDHLKWFEKNFADSRDGRPDGMEEFAKAFQDYLRGFYWKTRAAWTSLYTRKVPPAMDSPYVYDVRTWTWERNRAEPFFGQDHARAAGLLFLELGKKQEAVQALVWALSVDGPSPRLFELLCQVLKEGLRKNGAWVAAWAKTFPHGDGPGKAPFLGQLGETKRFLGALDEAAAGYGEIGLAHAAAVLFARRNHLAGYLGLAPREQLAAGEANKLYPFDGPARHLGLHGWAEADLTGYEEHRRSDLWYTQENGDLCLGRSKPVSATGGVDRSAHLHHVFALSEDPILPGTYTLKARVKFTTSYVSGAVVFGYTRRDRNLRFQFTAGDLMYAIGESEEEPSFEFMHYRLHGLWQRDGALPGAVPGGEFSFERPRHAFDLELHVDGAVAEAYINGTRVGAYHTADGSLIEGQVGFAVGYGACKVQKPRVERHDLSRQAGRLLPLALDLRRGESRPFQELVNMPVHGIDRSPNGKLLAWIPMPWLVEGEAFDPAFVEDQALKAAAKVRELLDHDLYPQPFTLAVPETLGEARVAALKSRLAEEMEQPPAVKTHAFKTWSGKNEEDAPDANRRWLLFVDSENVVRVVTSLPGVMLRRSFAEPLAHWLTVFRDHGRPDRELPAYKRYEEGDEDESEPG